MLTRALFVFLLLALPAPADLDHRSVIFDLQVAARLGERRIVAQPKLKVTSEQEASIVVAEDGQTRLELSVFPKIQGDLIRVAVKVLATDGDHRLQRTFQYTAIPGEAAQFKDEDADASLTLVVTATLSP